MGNCERRINDVEDWLGRGDAAAGVEATRRVVRAIIGDPEATRLAEAMEDAREAGLDAEKWEFAERLADRLRELGVDMETGGYGKQDS